MTDPRIKQIREIVGTAYEIRPQDVLGTPLSEEAWDSAIRYSFATGHRLVIDYRNTHGRPSAGRKIVVAAVPVDGLLTAYDVDKRDIRSFRVDRITAVALDG